MTDQQINIAVAEACGWSRDDGYIHWRDPDKFYRPTGEWKDYISGQVPPFATDLNAMHEAEEKLKEEQVTNYVWLLSTNMIEIGDATAYPNHWRTAHATARQRAEAFLRTIGKWRE